MNIQTISNILKKVNIRIPEWYWKEELVRYISEQQTERVVEIPLIFSYIPKTPVKILDVGCRYSLLSLQLASIGHSVTAADVGDYYRKHRNLTFVQSDIRGINLKANSFDVAISLSTIEHIGLGVYGDPQYMDGDRAAARSIRKLLKKGGKFLITIPFGKPRDTSWYRVYDKARVEYLLEGFTIKDMRVYKKENNDWIPCTVKEGNTITSGSEIYSGVAFIEAVKK